MTYVLAVEPQLLNHGSDVPVWLGDFSPADETSDSERREFNAIDAMAASGDCFVTLATRLDKMAQGLVMDSAEQIELEHMVRELFYLQDHWDVIAKRRQR